MTHFISIASSLTEDINYIKHKCLALHKKHNYSPFFTSINSWEILVQFQLQKRHDTYETTLSYKNMFNEQDNCHRNIL